MSCFIYQSVCQNKGNTFFQRRDQEPMPVYAHAHLSLRELCSHASLWQQVSHVKDDSRGCQGEAGSCAEFFPTPFFPPFKARCLSGTVCCQHLGCTSWQGEAPSSCARHSLQPPSSSPSSPLETENSQYFLSPCRKSATPFILTGQ